MITYRELSWDRTTVFLDKRAVGCIYATDGGFQYRPKGGAEGGDVFPTIADVKRSLEGAQ